jgi:hypothetical protein
MRLLRPNPNNLSGRLPDAPLFSMARLLHLSFLTCARARSVDRRYVVWVRVITVKGVHTQGGLKSCEEGVNKNLGRGV